MNATTLAPKHFAEDRRVIERQRALIDRQRRLGHDTAKSEDLLAPRLKVPR